MNESVNFAPVSKAARRTGYVVSVLPCLLLLQSSIGVKLVQPPGPGIPEHFAQLGWTMDRVLGLGVVELACTIIYLVPRTAVLGAILLTAYLGGAAAAHVRIGERGVAAFPICLGIALWAGLYLRDARLRPLIPLQR